MRITNYGRLVGQFDDFKFSDGEGRFFLSLKRVDVRISDVRNSTIQLEAHYSHLFRFTIENGAVNIETRFLGIGMLHIYITPRRISSYVELDEQLESDEITD